MEPTASLLAKHFAVGEDAFVLWRYCGVLPPLYFLRTLQSAMMLLYYLVTVESTASLLAKHFVAGEDAFAPCPASSVVVHRLGLPCPLSIDDGARSFF